MIEMATDHVLDNDGGARQGGWGVRYNKLTEMATDDAKPGINEGGSRNGWRRGEQTTDQNVDG